MNVWELLGEAMFYTGLIGWPLWFLLKQHFRAINKAEEKATVAERKRQESKIQILHQAYRIQRARNFYANMIHSYNEVEGLLDKYGEEGLRQILPQLRDHWDQEIAVENARLTSIGVEEVDCLTD